MISGFSKILLSHHWSFHLQRHPIFAPDEIYLTSSIHEHPKVINFPLGSSLDLGELIQKLPNNWYPDLFIAKVDSYFNIVPRNIEVLNCPKILILGDTQHGFDPLNQMIEYAKSEKYDFYITDHKRHHLWYYWLAGINNLYWLPGLFLNPPNLSFEQQPFQNLQLHDEFFLRKTIFVGQTGQFHPRRKKIVQYLAEKNDLFWYGQLSQKDSLKAFNTADISLNISLNGDLNLRNFEILSSKGFLLADKLTDESGINILLTEGEEYEAFSDTKELIDKISYFSKLPHAISKYRQKGYERYFSEFSPQRMVEVFCQVLHGQNIENTFTTKCINRILYCQDREFSRARISLYQVIQELHRDWETLEILLDARITFTSAVDFLDLPHVQIVLTNYDDAYVDRLEIYLRESGNISRVQFIKDISCYQHFNIIITSTCTPNLLSHLLAREVVIISTDFRGLDLSVQYTDLRNIVSHKEDFDSVFFILNRKSLPISNNQFDSHNFINNPSRKLHLDRTNSMKQANQQQAGRTVLLEQETSNTICIVHPNENAYSETFIRAHIEHLPAKVINLPGVWFPLRRDKLALKQFFIENDVDAVLAEFGPTGVALLEVCKEAQIPLVVHFHGMDANHHGVVSGEVGQRYPELFEYASALVVPSRFIQKRLIELGAPIEKIKVNPNGVDTSRFTPGNPALSPPIFLAVSRFVDVKGPHLSILAFKKVVERFKEACLIMIGDGFLFESCRKITEALQISTSVQFLGVKNSLEIAELMRSSRAFIQHSICTSDGQCEAQGVVFLEAGASGLPVITTKSGGIPEVVVDGETGFLVEELDIDEMAESMLRLAEDAALAAQFGKTARERIHANFSREKSIDGLWEIIQQSIQEFKKDEPFPLLNLREINLVIFPDWSQTEESLYVQMENVIRAIVIHPNSSQITLLVITGDTPEEEAALILSTVSMNLLMQEDLNISEEPAISLVAELNQIQWQALLPRIRARISIKNENQELITKSEVQKIPVVQIDSHTAKMQSIFLDSAKYWENRYLYSGTSGIGSYGRLAEFKAEIINSFVAENNINTVIEFGCGDGNQLRYAKYPRYTGLDISSKAIHLCSDKFKNDSTKAFFLYSPTCFIDKGGIFKSDLALSLDVIFHLVENDIFYLYMNHLFNSAIKFVIIYSSDYEQELTNASHVKHRKFSDYIAQHRQNWVLLRKISNRYPTSEYQEQGSFCDFYIYQKTGYE